MRKLLLQKSKPEPASRRRVTIDIAYLFSNTDILSAEIECKRMDWQRSHETGTDNYKDMMTIVVSRRGVTAVLTYDFTRKFDLSKLTVKVKGGCSLADIDLTDLFSEISFLKGKLEDSYNRAVAHSAALPTN